MVKTVNLPVKEITRERVRNLGKKSETWDTLINRMVDEINDIVTLKDRIKELEKECEKHGVIFLKELK